MPVVEVDKEDLERLVSTELPPSLLEGLLASLKCEVERIEGSEIKYEIERDRPDLFSTEGLARALRGLLEIETGLREFKVEGPFVTMVVDGPDYRPYALGAVVKGLRLDDEALKQIMGLQEKLHETYCRRRRKVSIGIYDLSKVTPPIYYSSVKKDEILFTPLGHDKAMGLDEILTLTDKGREYGHLLMAPTYPILRDSEGRVLSLPPIINSEDTAVEESTRDVFIDVTGTDLRLMKEVLSVMVTSVAERGESIGLVKVTSKGSSSSSPDLAPTVFELKLSYVHRVLGLKLGEKDVVRALLKMRHSVREGGESLVVEVAPYRLDILHQVDLIEDVAMAYGYDRLPYELLPSTSPGRIASIEFLSRKLRDIMIGLGFQEIANYMFSNDEVLLKKMRIEGVGLIRVENPKSSTYTALRNWIIPQLIQVHAENRGVGYPQKIFEVGDIVLPCESTDVRAVTRRHLACSIASKDATLTDVLVTLKALFKALNVNYRLEPLSHPSFIEGRAAKIKVGERDAGLLGEVHPEVLYNFEVTVPIVVLEVDVTELLGLIIG